MASGWIEDLARANFLVAELDSSVLCGCRREQVRTRDVLRVFEEFCQESSLVLSLPGDCCGNKAILCVDGIWVNI